jgi:hypothetical protein
MTKKDKEKKIVLLYAAADRLEASVSGGAGPSSEAWVSPERQAHYYAMADEKRREAKKLEAEIG